MTWYANNHWRRRAQRRWAGRRSAEVPGSAAVRSGDRICLVRCTDVHTRLQPGLHGTVSTVDDLGTVHVKWDDGCTLGLVPGEDQWERVEAERR